VPCTTISQGFALEISGCHSSHQAQRKQNKSAGGGKLSFRSREKRVFMMQAKAFAAAST
jgi:hypothetical protein